jgi:REP element-mobilizing transposase RayT/DNA-binding response OmpR family regulator
MAIPVMVVTPNAGFGELICQILEETGKYAIALATTPQEAVAIAKKDRPALCILEIEPEDKPSKGLVGLLRKEVEHMLLILIPSHEDILEEEFAQLNPEGFLAKPFYLPDLVTLVEEVISNSDIADLPQVKTGPQVKRPSATITKGGLPPAPEWLKDVSLAAQHLTRLSLESSSQAALITRDDQIWAYAGELPQNAAEELARTVATYFADGGGTDLARFVSLEETGSEYMMYASGLGGEYVLAMVFDAEMPFSKIRSQATRLTEALSKTNPPEPSRRKTTMDTAPVEEPTGYEPSEPPKPLWDDVPPPIPNDWIPETEVSSVRRGFLDDLLEDDASVGPTRPDVFTYDTSPIKQTEGGGEPQPVNLAVDTPEATEKPDYMDDTIVSKADRNVELPETIKSRVSRVSRITKVEPVSPSVYNLTYACVLIPRFPHHHLTGAVATRLSDWINNMSVAFGWRLEHLSIRPEYMQWMVNVPPNTSPGYLMRTIRQHTSRRMFVEFPRLEEDNPSGDFWAHGYLIMSGNQPPPPQLVKDFIRNTRKRQGIIK